MLITGNQILKRNFLDHAHPENLSGSSYYLTIHSIIPSGEDAATFDPDKQPPHRILQPGGIAWVISKEVFSISEHNVTGLVTLRSSFTKEGILALDVGLVDAGYQGPIGSVVINFSKNDVTLTRGHKFFRVIFLEHEELEADYQYSGKPISHADYINDRLQDLTKNFSETFLQAGLLAKSVQSKVVDDLSENMIDSLVSQGVKKHWLKILVFLLVVTLGAYSFWPWSINKVWTPAVQTQVICELVKNKLVKPEALVDNTCG